MATVVSITNPITGAVEQVDKLDHTAQQIDDAVALAPQLSNHNILDNWYFGNPVNQRGQTEYSTIGYTIDRWKLPVLHLVSLQDNGIKVTCNAAASANFAFAQLIEGLEIGKQYTLSALIVENTTTKGVGLRHGNSASSAILGTGLYTFTFNATAADNTSGFGIQFTSRADDDNNYIVVAAIKLELGSQQTLAHQDADGNWVLNEIPDYGEQLLRCQRYFQTFATESLRPTDALDFRPVMRTNPALSTIAVGGKTLYTASADL